MKYHYYPGCSLEGTAVEYNRATRAVMAALGAKLEEIEGWTCCGASAAEATSELLALALPARNLALAERCPEPHDLLVPCSACYLNLKQVVEKMRAHAPLRATVISLLKEEGLRLQGRVTVRHLLDVLATDLGPEAICAKVTRPLSGLRIAPYYGCQCLRPYAVFDDPEVPTSMEPLIRSLGAEVFPWAMGGRCCGASHMNTRPEVGKALVAKILEAARGADAIATVCPMCQMNLEAYQHAVSRSRHTDLHVNVVYLPQLIGSAFGLPEAELGMNFNLALSGECRRRFAAETAAAS
jgi:heterodisulfide reductase subunit B2